MIVTREWIDQNQTGNCAWTADQLKILGVSWPPSKGWKQKVIGLILSDEQRIRFEHLGQQRRIARGRTQGSLEL
jgi:hypothetical protein